jgi:hypothetical protein
MVSENSQLTVEPEQADFGRVLKAHTPGTKCLVPNCQGEFAGLVQGPPHDKTVLTLERFRFETNILDVYAFSHQSPFVPARRDFYGLNCTRIVLTDRRQVCIAAQEPSPLGSAAEGVT